MSLIVLMAIGPALAGAASSPQTVQAEVIVYGVTSAGITAAVAAARKGHTVALAAVTSRIVSSLSPSPNHTT